MESRKCRNKIPRPYESSAPEISQPSVDGPAYESIKMIDILPLLLCIGIVSLLYFIVREIQNEQENQEVRYVSLLKRMESLEKKE